MLLDTCNSIGIHERAATWLFAYFMKKPVSSSLEIRLSPNKRYVTVLHDERSFSSVEIIIFLLVVYTKHDVIAGGNKELQSYT